MKKTKSELDLEAFNENLAALSTLSVEDRKEAYKIILGTKLSPADAVYIVKRQKGIK